MTNSSGTDSACGACHDEPVLLALTTWETETIRQRAVPGHFTFFSLGSVELNNWGAQAGLALLRFHSHGSERLVYAVLA